MSSSVEQDLSRPEAAVGGYEWCRRDLRRGPFEFLDQRFDRGAGIGERGVQLGHRRPHGRDLVVQGDVGPGRRPAGVQLGEAATGLADEFGQRGHPGCHAGRKGLLEVILERDVARHEFLEHHVDLGQEGQRFRDAYGAAEPQRRAPEGRHRGVRMPTLVTLVHLGHHARRPDGRGRRG